MSTSDQMAIGMSTSLSFDEAFRDALSRLPSLDPGQLSAFGRVTDVWWGEGGITGHPQLYVRVVRRPSLRGAPSGLEGADPPLLPPVGSEVPFPWDREDPFPWDSTGPLMNRGGPVPNRATTREPTLVRRVIEGGVAVLESNPPTYAVAAVGEVPTSGWGPTMLRRTKPRPGDTGVLRFDLVSIPPSPGSMVLQVLSKVVAPPALVSTGDDVTAVIVRGALDSIEIPRSEFEGAAAAPAS